jgi:hypothetical protein
MIRGMHVAPALVFVRAEAGNRLIRLRGSAPLRREISGQDVSGSRISVADAVAGETGVLHLRPRYEIRHSTASTPVDRLRVLPRLDSCAVPLPPCLLLPLEDVSLFLDASSSKL